MSKLLSLALILLLAGCGPMQANQIERMGIDARLALLEKKTDQELCNAFTNPHVGPSTRGQLHAILVERHIDECTGKTGIHAYVVEPKPDTTGYKQRELTAAEKKIIASYIRQALKDPDSAQFRWGKYMYKTPRGGSYCGEVNAKNSFGGYTGFEPYHVLLSWNDAGKLEPSMGVVDGAWSLCKGYR